MPPDRFDLSDPLAASRIQFVAFAIGVAWERDMPGFKRACYHMLEQELGDLCPDDPVDLSPLAWVHGAELVATAKPFELANLRRRYLAGDHPGDQPPPSPTTLTPPCAIKVGQWVTPISPDKTGRTWMRSVIGLTDDGATLLLYGDKTVPTSRVRVCSRAEVDAHFTARKRASPGERPSGSVLTPSPIKPS